MPTASSALTRANVLLQLAGWAVLIGAPMTDHLQRPAFANAEPWVIFGIQQILLVTFFYTNYLYLIPRILRKKDSRTYILLVVFTSVAALLLMYLPEWISNQLHGGSMPSPFKHIVIVLQIYAASTAWRLFADYIDRQLIEKKLEQEKKDAQIRFLRSQINPHFLFNTLNNINALIRNKPDEAERSVVQLSYLMRYMLNSGQKHKAALVDEIEYIKNYIALQHLRLATDFKLTIEITGETSGKEIEPLLLIGFIENTFKHGISGEDSDFIELRIALNDKTLLLVTRNAIPNQAADKELASGIGLKNTLNRLELCYKDRFLLNVSTENGIYSTHLEIEL